MIHISPWEATVGLIKGAAAILAPGSPLYLYGPYKREGFETAPSNQAFDHSLRDRDPNWGLRDLEAVVATVHSAGFSEPVITEMPTNLSVVFRRVWSYRCVDDRPPNGRLRNSHRARGSSLGVSRLRGSDDRMPEERGEKSNHNDAKDKTPRFENIGGVVARGQPVGIAHAKLLGRPPASQPHQTLIKIT
jgi:uncharacterized protein DUF938